MKEIWGWFLELNNTRTSGFGPSPITFTEMKSYFSLYDIDITVTEVELIKMLDSIAMSTSKKQEENKNNKTKK